MHDARSVESQSHICQNKISGTIAQSISDDFVRLRGGCAADKQCKHHA